jgi:tetratricopeptide (TPR) repeat protein
MRKLITLVLILSCFSTVFAQKSTVKEAKSALNSGKLNDAKSAIDKAIADTGTVKLSETWFLRGKIYQDICESPLPMYKNLDADSIPAFKSFEAYMKAMEISKTEKKDKYRKDIIKSLPNVKNALIADGSNAYNKSSNEGYEKAYNCFKSCVAIDQLPEINFKDTVIIYYTGLAALNLKKWDDAITYFDQAAKLNIKEPRVIVNWANALKGKGDTAKAIDMLRDGMTKYPNDNILMINEIINYFLVAGQTKEAHVYLDQAIAKDPKNESYHFAKGTLYDKEFVTNSKESDFEQAMVCYRKSVEINPNYFNGYYNLGAMHFNKAAKILEGANKLPLNENAKYEVEVKKAAEQFKLALPFMEKANEVDPTDISTLQTLSTIYLKLEMKDKQKVIKDKIDAIQQK